MTVLLTLYIMAWCCCIVFDFQNRYEVCSYGTTNCVAVTAIDLSFRAHGFISFIGELIVYTWH